MCVERLSQNGVAFVPGSLEGESIEDVAHETFNAWGVGRKPLDNGVLLVVAPKERRVRIETGKGVGDKITDLQSSDIIEHTVSPLVREGRYRDAIDQGTQAIAVDLGGGAPGNDGAEPLPASALWKIGLFIAAAILVLVLAAVSPGFRQVLFLALAVGGRRVRRRAQRRLRLSRRRRKVGRRRRERKLLTFEVESASFVSLAMKEMPVVDSLVCRRMRFLPRELNLGRRLARLSRS